MLMLFGVSSRWHVGRPWLSGDDVNQERIAVSRPLVPFYFILFICLFIIAIPRTVSVRWSWSGYRES